MIRHILPLCLGVMLFSFGLSKSYASEAQDLVLLLDKRAYSDVSAQFVRKLVESVSQQRQQNLRFSAIVVGNYVSFSLPLHEIGKADAKGALNDVLSYWSDSSIGSDSAQGNPAIGVDRSIDELRTNGNVKARKNVIVLSPGGINTGDRQSDSEFANWLLKVLVEDAAQEKIQVDWIAHGSAQDVKIIEAVTLATGGSHFQLTNPASSHSLMGNLVKILDLSSEDPASGQIATLTRDDAIPLVNRKPDKAATEHAGTTTSTAEKSPLPESDVATGSIKTGATSAVDQPAGSSGESSSRAQYDAEPAAKAESLTGSIKIDEPSVVDKPTTPDGESLNAQIEAAPAADPNSITGNIEIGEPSAADKPAGPSGESSITPFEAESAPKPVADQQVLPQEWNLFVYLFILAGLMVMGVGGYLIFRGKRSLDVKKTSEKVSEQSAAIAGKDLGSVAGGFDALSVASATSRQTTRSQSASNIEQAEDLAVRSSESDAPSIVNPPSKPEGNENKYVTEDAEELFPSQDDTGLEDRDNSGTSSEETASASDNDNPDTIPMAIIANMQTTGSQSVSNVEQVDDLAARSTAPDAPTILIPSPDLKFGEEEHIRDDNVKAFSPRDDAESKDKDNSVTNNAQSASASGSDAAEFMYVPDDEMAEKPVQKNRDPAPEPQPTESQSALNIEQEDDLPVQSAIADVPTALNPHQKLEIDEEAGGSEDIVEPNSHNEAESKHRENSLTNNAESASASGSDATEIVRVPDVETSKESVEKRPEPQPQPSTLEERDDDATEIVRTPIQYPKTNKPDEK